MKASKKEFVAETEEILFECRQLVLEIQDTYQTAVNPDTVNAFFRAIHTLKGLSGLFGNQSVTDVSHGLESLLDEVRLGKVTITGEVVDFLFRSIDILVSAVEAVKEDRDTDLNPFIQEIKTFRASLQEGESGPGIEGLIDNSILRVLSEYEEHRLKANIKAGNGIYLLKTVFDLSTFDTTLEETSKKIKSKGELISTLPTSADIPDGSIGFNLMFSSAVLLDELQKQLEGDIDVLVQPKQT